MSKTNKHTNSVSLIKGFTIVELLIVITIIGILAAISFVAYSGIQRNAVSATAKSSLASVVRAFKLAHVGQNEYSTSFPDNISLAADIGIALTQVDTADTFCINVTSAKFDDIQFHADQTEVIQEGLCGGDVIEDSVMGDYNSGNQAPLSAAGVAHGDLYGLTVTTNESWSTITISWDTVDNTTKYQIQTRISPTDSWLYRKIADGSGSYAPGSGQNDTNSTITGNISSTIHSLTWSNAYPAQVLSTGQTFDYRLRSIGPGGAQSEWSIATLSAPNNSTVNTPTVTSFDVTPATDWSSITMSWSEPNGTAVVPVPEYQLQTRTAIDGTWVYRRTSDGYSSYPPGSGQNDTNNSLTGSIPMATTSLNWLNSYGKYPISSGQTHEFRIRIGSSRFADVYGPWKTVQIHRP